MEEMTNHLKIEFVVKTQYTILWIYHKLIVYLAINIKDDLLM